MTLEQNPGSGCFKVELERMPNQSRGSGDERCEDSRRNEESITDLLLGVMGRKTPGTSNLVNSVSIY